MASGLARTCWLNGLNGGHVFNLSLNTHKMAMHNATFFSGFNFDTGLAWVNTNEVTGTNWVTTGYALSAVQNAATINPAVAGVAGGIIRYTMDNLARTGTTISASSGIALYADALGSPVAKPVFAVVDFGAPYTTTSGTFGINWSGNGVFEIDLS